MTTDQPIDLSGASIVRADFSGARIRASDFRGVTMRAVDLDGLDVDDHDLQFGRLVVNGVDVVPLVEAELDRRFPGRALQHATTPEGLREGWVAVQDAWAETVDGTPAELRDVQVDGEWSLVQTLRHLVLATDAWLRGGVHGEEQPFHEIGLPFSGAGQMGFDMSVFRDGAAGDVSYEEVLEVRADRQKRVTAFLADTTPALLADPRSNPWNPSDDWAPTVGDCIRVILEEEWAHLRYLRRDLATLAVTTADDPEA